MIRYSCLDSVKSLMSVNQDQYSATGTPSRRNIVSIRGSKIT